jgi:hypothetical protein
MTISKEDIQKAIVRSIPEVSFAGGGCSRNKKETCSSCPVVALARSVGLGSVRELADFLEIEYKSIYCDKVILWINKKHEANKLKEILA